MFRPRSLTLDWQDATCGRFLLNQVQLSYRNAKSKHTQPRANIRAHTHTHHKQAHTHNIHTHTHAHTHAHNIHPPAGSYTIMRCLDADSPIGCFAGFEPVNHQALWQRSSGSNLDYLRSVWNQVWSRRSKYLNLVTLRHGLSAAVCVCSKQCAYMCISTSSLYIERASYIEWWSLRAGQFCKRVFCKCWSAMLGTH